MKRSMRDKWIEALRSGKYQQGKDYLRKNDSYCCLGVLCDLDGAEWEIHCPKYYKNAYITSGRYPGELHSLSFGHSSELGIASKDIQTVINMNDTGRSFAEIADWIEANVPVEED